MIIVNQNKKVIINFNNINYIAIDDNKPLIFTRTNNNAEITLGIYKTKKRAEEVLQEIVDTYKFNRCYAVGQKQAVYQMPEE